MKKTYIAPEIESVKLNPVQMLANSTDINIKSGTISNQNDVLSKEYNSGSFLWDDTEGE